MKTAKVGKRISLRCIQCDEIKSINKFFPAAIIRPYSRVCIDCRREQLETDQYEKELQSDDTNYAAFISKSFRE